MSASIELLPALMIGPGENLLIIAGPCQIESEQHSLKIADALATLQEALPVSIVFKASFDKANRTSISGVRGPGMEEGLKILDTVRSRTGLPILTDVHLPNQVAAVAEVVDILQTPAFLCRQTDLLQAVGLTGKPVNIKKGQFLAAEDMKFAAEKVKNAGGGKILLCERGTSFGYRDLVVDMRNLIIMRNLGFPVIFDATHSVQSPGGEGGASGGSREYIAPLVRASVATGVDGLFIECHDDPNSAPSDGKSMLPLEAMDGVLKSACQLRDSLR